MRTHPRGHQRPRRAPQRERHRSTSGQPCEPEPLPPSGWIRSSRFRRTRNRPEPLVTQFDQGRRQPHARQRRIHTRTLRRRRRDSGISVPSQAECAVRSCPILPPWHIGGDRGRGHVPAVRAGDLDHRCSPSWSMADKDVPAPRHGDPVLLGDKHDPIFKSSRALSVLPCPAALATSAAASRGAARCRNVNDSAGKTAAERAEAWSSREPPDARRASAPFPVNRAHIAISAPVWRSYADPGLSRTDCARA